MNWIIGTAKSLRAELRKPGPVRGHSAFLKRYLTLHKTDLLADLAREFDTTPILYRIDGNPEETGRYAKDRRTVTIWLGRK